MNSTDIIKDKLNILDVVSSYVKLEKAGKTYKGKSPFTHEKTPSFFVSPEKGFFYCFSSGKGGDIFTFVQEIERVEFKDALKILAEKAGVPLSHQNPEQQSRDQIRYKILDEATKRYEIHLRKNSQAVEYLLSRGLKKETLIQFRIGFALDGWSDIYDFLQHRKYEKSDMRAVGLITNKEGTERYYDRFRSRIMFPIFDSRSRVIGFSGRIFSHDEDLKVAKYINSPEGPLFDKSSVLYGYHTAKSAISKAGSCILVEGQFDVLMAQQVGYVHTVAVSGTGLTENHVAMIKRFTDTVIMAFDSDKAGIKATRRSALMAYRHGMNVRVVSMSENMDPADLIAHSKEQWDVCVADAQDYINYRLHILSQQNQGFEVNKKIIHQDIFTFVYLMKSAITQDKVLQKIALFLGVSVEAVRADFATFIPEDDIELVEQVPVSETSTQDNKKDISTDTQKEILYLYTYFQEKKITFDEKKQQKVLDLYQEIYESDILTDVQNIPDTEKNMQLFVLEEKYQDANEQFFLQAVHTMLCEEKIRMINQESQSILEKIRQTESTGDIDGVIALQKEHQHLLAVKTTLMNSIR